jgi:hypothetical protein
MFLIEKEINYVDIDDVVVRCSLPDCYYNVVKNAEE